MRNITEINGLEANLLLFALDGYMSVGMDGKVAKGKDGLRRAQVQALRDRLMAVHEHPRVQDQ